MVTCPWLPPEMGGLVTSHLGAPRARRARALRAPHQHSSYSEKPGTTVMPQRCHKFLSAVAFAAVAFVAVPCYCTANALKTYVQQAGRTFSWNSATPATIGNF